MTATSSLLLLILLLAKTSKAHEFRIQPRVLTRSQRFLLHPLHDEECVFKSSGCQIRGGGGAQDYYRSEEPDDNDSDRYSEDFSARSRRDDDRYGDDTYERDYRNSDKSSLPSIPKLTNIIKNGDRRIGLALLGSGTVFTMLGVSLFFNKSLMRLGNLLFIGGVPMTIGPGRTAGYFFQPKKSRATACLALGIFLVFIGNPVFGIILEVFGLLNLFGNMFPLVAVLLKQMPIVGALFGGGGAGNRRPTRSPREDRYDDDRRNDESYRDSYNDQYYEDGRYDRGKGEERW